MWKSLCGSLGILLITSLICSAALYHAKKNADQALADMETSMVRAQLETVTAALEIGRRVSAQREGAYAAIHDAGERSAVGIATAGNDPGSPDEVDIDSYLPLSLTDQRIVHHEAICAATGCGVAGSVVVRSKTHAGTKGAKGPEDNAQAVGRGK